MKNYILLLLSLLATAAGFAQDYSIISGETKTYFTNASGYLRGIRIDSVHTDNGVTTYYPFRTARTYYGDWNTIADTTGGSWQGKYILEDTAGNSRIPTQTGDTVLIKGLALLNESWTFYADTAAAYYTATVTAIDTATFAGIFDTVKTIRLNVFSNGTIDTGNVINGLEIKLSKNHGWLQTIDLYLFPYRPGPDGYNYDCYLYQSLFNINSINPASNNGNFIFARIAFKYPELKDIHNFQIGDVFYSNDRTRYVFNGGLDSDSYYRDSIISKSETDSFYTYTSRYQSSFRTYSPPNTTNSSGIRNINKRKIGIIYGDTTKMPEEVGCIYYYYYLPDDSSFCYRSPKFAMLADKIINNRFGGGGPEPSYPYNIVKEGMSVIMDGNGVNHPDNPNYSYDLWWARKTTSPCDAINQIVAVKEISKESGPDIKIYPNPASVSLHIGLPYDADCMITLYTVTGTKAFQEQIKGRQLEIDVSGLAPGNYFLKYSDKYNTVVRKISILH